MTKEFRDDKGFTENEFLAHYKLKDYERPSITVDPVLLTVVDGVITNPKNPPRKKLQVLLIKRGGHPFIYHWALPGGFIQMNESSNEGAYRELEEETSIRRDQVYLEQLYTWNDPHRDPRGRIISISYMALVDSGRLDVRAGSDARDARWFTIELFPFKKNKSRTAEGFIQEEYWRLNLINEDLPATEEFPALTAVIRITRTVEGNIIKTDRQVIESCGIAFDHAAIIEYSMFRLKNKIEWTDIAFALMPPLFSLGDLQRVYEAILGRELTDPNFRRKMGNKVIETNEKELGVPWRPSKLYRFNPNWDEESF